ncbi:MAG: rRNA pseudouridine synthase [Bacteroidetes bacterium]|nr:rRNA pseudouridine synthase [Bacteroidota bacterium]
MSFYRRIKYFLVHTLKHSNKVAQELIDKGHVEVNGLTIAENCILYANSEIKVNGIIEQEKKEFVYLKFHKPAGYESTLNKNIAQNLSAFFAHHNELFIAGRLDKQSEGLLILSNDGKWVEELCNPKFEKEKEYLVELDKPITTLFVTSFMNGVEIDAYLTKKCFCEKINETTIKVILTEGKNRQIRKMCKVLGYNVLKLKRTRVSNFLLTDLQLGKIEFIKI